MVDTKLPLQNRGVQLKSRMRNTGVNILSSNKDYDDWYNKSKELDEDIGDGRKLKMYTSREKDKDI